MREGRMGDQVPLEGSPGAREKVRQLLHKLKQVAFRLDCHARELHARWVVHAVASFSSRTLAPTARPAIVFAPHQDDETLGCGGMIAQKRQAGARVTLVFLTDGRQSHEGHDDKLVDDLASVRRSEALAAAKILGIGPEDVIFLSYPDGGLTTLAANLQKQLVDELSALITKVGAREVYCPHRSDRHLDHEACFRYVQQAVVQSGADAELLQYSIWMPWRSPLLWRMKLRDLSNGYRLAIDRFVATKLRAINAYQTQLAVLPHGFLRRFGCPYEVYFKVSPVVSESASAPGSP